MYYDGNEADALPTNCDEIILFKALLELHFQRHSIQRFSHMLDCHNLVFANGSSKTKITKCTSVAQMSHIDYFQLLPSTLNLDGKFNRESIFDNLPLSFVVGIDNGVKLRFHTSLNSALLNGDKDEISTIFSLEGAKFDEKYPMTSITMKPGQVVVFSGTTMCYL